MQSYRAMDLRWDDMKLLLALWREGSLSGASVRLGIDTSTVGRRLDALEASMGLHLFDRTFTGVLPTEAAEALLPAAERMEHAAADVLRAVEGRETEPEGTVRITAPPGWASFFVAPALVRLAERHPKLRIQLDAAVGYADLTRREADLALRVSRPAGGDLVARKVADAELVPMAAPEVVCAAGRVRDLNELRWITWADDLAHLPDAQWIFSQVAPERVVLRTSSIESQVRAMEAGLGAGLHLPVLERLAGLERLRVAPALARRLPPRPAGSMWIVTHRALRQVPRVAVVWDFLVEELTPLLT
jgi:DNA-binding transcriptional LysR family regulator